MVDKVTLVNLADLQNETTAVLAFNANNAAITTAMNNTLSRDGTSPNQMGAALDMNSHQIINLPNPSTSTSPLRLQDLSDFIGTGIINTLPSGGSTNQVLTKISNANYDAGWRAAASGVVSVLSFGAIGDAVADDTAAIAAAIAATPPNGIVYFPAGAYKVVGSGSAIFTIPLPLNFRGDGWSSVIFVPGTVPNTRDIFHIVPSGTLAGGGFKDLAVRNYGVPTAGRHGIHFDLPSSMGVLNWNISNCYIEQMAGHSINLTNAGNSWAYSTIRECNVESINLVGLGDGITIRNCTISATGTNAGIYAYNIPGAANLAILENVIVGFNGHIVFDGGADVIIRDNELETPIGIPNTYGYVIDLKGSHSNTFAPILAENSISVLTGTNNPIPIRVQANTNTQISGGRISVQTGPHIKVEATSADCWIDSAIQYITNSVIGAASITDAGSNTSFMPKFGLGVANNLGYFSTSTKLSPLATANNGVLVTSGGGVPSIATTLPTSLTIPSPTVNTAATFVTGASNNLLIKQFSTNTYNAITFNNDVTGTTMIGFIGGASGDSNLYTRLPTGGTANIAVNGFSLITMGSAGINPFTDNTSALGTGALRWADMQSVTATHTTSLTTPKVIGGTAAGSTLTLQTTSGTGSGDIIKFTRGTNGAVEMARMGLGGGAATSGLAINSTTIGDNFINFGAAPAAGSGFSVDRSTGGLSGTGISFGAGGASSGGTNLNGGSVTFLSGTSTGSGHSEIYFFTHPQGTTGTADTTLKQTLKLNQGSVVVGPNVALSTTATDGFLYIPTSAGAPTGTPTANTGTVAMQYDTTNNFLYIYNGGWKKNTVFA